MFRRDCRYFGRPELATSLCAKGNNGHVLNPVCLCVLKGERQ